MATIKEAILKIVHAISGKYVQIEHDGSDATIKTSAEDLTIKNEGEDKDIIFVIDDGGVETEVARILGADSALRVFNQIRLVQTGASDPYFPFYEGAASRAFLRYDISDNVFDIVVNEAGGNIDIAPSGTGKTLFSSGDVEITNELKGSKHSVILSNDAGATLSGTRVDMKAGEVSMTATKGLTMIRDGSIVGISVNYDVTAKTDSPMLKTYVAINDVNKWGEDLDETIANDKEAYFTQARGTDTFSAGDTIDVALMEQLGAPHDITVDDIIIMLEFYYDS